MLYIYIRNIKHKSAKKDQIKNILNIIPGDSLDILFTDSLTIEYERRFWKDGELVIDTFTSSVNRMNAYYWDEDDHKKLDFYFYEDSSPYWIAKWWDLTEESQKKVLEFIQKNHK